MRRQILAMKTGEGGQRSALATKPCPWLEVERAEGRGAVPGVGWRAAESPRSSPAAGNKAWEQPLAQALLEAHYFIIT